MDNRRRHGDVRQRGPRRNKTFASARREPYHCNPRRRFHKVALPLQSSSADSAVKAVSIFSGGSGVDANLWLRRFGAVIFTAILSAVALSQTNAPQGADLVRARYTKYEYMIRMRDGVRLFTAVYVPKDS